MYKINSLSDPHPYRSTGRVFLSKHAKGFYDQAGQIILENPPSWVKSFKPGDWIYVEARYTFKSKKRFPDPNNLHICLINGIDKALKQINPLVDDQWILMKDLVPKFGDEESTEFTLELIKDDRRRHEKKERSKRRKSD